MTWGTVTIGGIAFREELTVQETGDGKVTVKGQDSTPPQELAAVLAAHRNVLALAGAPLVPVTFTDKAGLTGFYRVEDVSSELFQFAGGAVVTASWQVNLVRLGTERDVQFESRVPTIARLTDHGSVTPEFWHAPPAGTRDYYTGVTVPAASTLRASRDGAVTVYRGLPDDSVPRWTVPAGSYMAGSARVLLDGIRRAGLDTPKHSRWELSNGIVRVTGAPGGGAGVIRVSCWSGGGWRSPRDFDLYVGSDWVPAGPELTILRNEPEEATVRLAWPVGAGRITLDLSLRRGARFVTGVVKRHASTFLAIEERASGPGTAATGGVVETDADADGNRYVLGSPTTVAVNAAAGGISLGTARLDFFAGHQVGAAPADGDAYADLLAQYLGTTGETVRGVRR